VCLALDPGDQRAQQFDHTGPAGCATLAAMVADVECEVSLPQRRASAWRDSPRLSCWPGTAAAGQRRIGDELLVEVALGELLVEVALGRVAAGRRRVNRRASWSRSAQRRLGGGEVALGELLIEIALLGASLAAADRQRGRARRVARSRSRSAGRRRDWWPSWSRSAQRWPGAAADRRRATGRGRARRAGCARVCTGSFGWLAEVPMAIEGVRVGAILFSSRAALSPPDSVGQTARFRRTRGPRCHP
jgi:hypothetical protein